MPDPGGGPIEGLERLLVIDKLEVGPVRLEPRRLVAPYRVSRGGRAEETELSYRFDEDVFDPASPADRNLADLMAAQVALNYGLFCRELVLVGRFDRHDQSFLLSMARNTAREIYVIKLLQPNPFFTDAGQNLPLLKRESYLQAEVLFADPDGSPARRPPDRIGDPWAVDRDRYMVLSSGGKDSLISFGLLQELGRQVEAAFINESGRHWFTALNAFRYFSAQVPGTSRIWTSSDRVFSWMLRHLPFVRPDFARLRSDEYPVRLWTVAVFIFGALPLLRRRGVGRLVIGNEFDTTQRMSYHGITHYNGLYDQSRFFDNAMTRYFRRKQWGLTQFSIVRPLSELLIEKVLVERYPKLQALQVSCHATHTDGEQVRPCGRCEKCRRIISMLVALDADPSRCGYTPQQVQQCLTELPDKGLHQEAAGIRHVGFMLADRGHLPGQAIGSQPVRAHPEVLKLRFDPDRAPLDGIPVDLREPLYRILLEHAEGAVKRSGRLWTDLDPQSDPDMLSPYTFEMPVGPARPAAGGYSYKAGGRDFVLGDLTWPRARQRFREVDVALLPVGSIEQHGPHLPLDVDTYDAEYLALRVAEACSEPRPLVLATIPYGVSYHHADFSGTIAVNPETLSRLVYEVGMAAARNGISKLVIVNGHGGNAPALHFAAQMINRDARIFTCVDTGETSDADILAMTETPNDVHAGEVETSTTLAVRPDLVDLKAARRSVPRFSSRYLDFASKRSVGWYAYTKRISPDGTMGDPTKASREKGERMWQAMIDHLCHFVEDLKALSLDEIFQRHL